MANKEVERTSICVKHHKRICAECENELWTFTSPSSETCRIICAVCDESCPLRPDDHPDGYHLCRKCDKAYLVGPESGEAAAPPARKVCKYGDPFCPCQDGDMCHYEGPNPMPRPAGGAPPPPAKLLGVMEWQFFKSLSDKVEDGDVSIDELCQESTPSRDVQIRLWHHPLIAQAHDVVHAIELCGSSEQLTTAVTKASALLQAIANFLADVPRSSNG